MAHDISFSDTAQEARDTLTSYISEQLIDAATKHSGGKFDERDRNILKSVAAIIADTVYFIYNEMKDGKMPSRSSVAGFIYNRIKNFAGISNDSITMCAFAVVDLAITTSAMYPAMVTGAKVGIFTGLMGPVGWGWSAASFGLASMAGIMVFLSAVDTAHQCGPAIEDRWLKAPTLPPGSPRPTRTLAEQTHLTFLELHMAAEVPGQCEAPKF